MHELGITQEIVNLVCEQAGGAKVHRVVVEIGRLTAVLPDAVRFAFELCAADTVAAEGELEIIEIPGRAQCRQCGQQQVFDQPFGTCLCGSLDLEWLSGFELTIKEIEVACHV